MNARWRTTKQAGVPCGSCGKVGTCTVSPDGTAFKCWRDGGKVAQMKPATGRSSYVGRARRSQLPISAAKGAAASKRFPSAEAAAVAAQRSAAAEAGAAVEAAGEWIYLVGGQERL